MVNKKLIIASIVCVVIIISGIYIAFIMDDSDTKSRLGENITTKEAYDLIQNNIENPDFIILDVRTQEEYNSGHIENASMLDFYDESFEDDLDQMDKNKTYLVYCRTANRSGRAVDIMVELGFTDVYNMLGGIVKWNEDGYKIVK